MYSRFFPHHDEEFPLVLLTNTFNSIFVKILKLPHSKSPGTSPCHLERPVHTAECFIRWVHVRESEYGFILGQKKVEIYLLEIKVKIEKVDKHAEKVLRIQVCTNKKSSFC